MPRYMIERTWGKIDDAQLAKAAQRSIRIAKEKYEDISWERSDVVSDDSGVMKSFCVYDAPNPERLRAHAVDLGGHVVDKIYVVGGTVSPSDFPS